MINTNINNHTYYYNFIITYQISHIKYPPQYSLAIFT